MSAPGFDPAGVETMTLILPSSPYVTFKQIAPFWRELTTRVEALPGVTRAGATDNLPLGGTFGCSGVVLEGAADASGAPTCVAMVTVTPGYFEAMGIRVRGRLPTWADVDAQTGPVVASGVVADRHWGGLRAIGHGIRPFNPRMPPRPIVGVAEDMRGNGLRNPLVDAVYFPLVPADNDLVRANPGWWSNAVDDVRRAGAEREPRRP